MGSFGTGVVTNLGGFDASGAQLGLVLALGGVGILLGLLCLGDVAFDLRRTLIEDGVEFRHEELVEEQRDDDKDDQGPHDVVDLRNEQLEAVTCGYCHHEALLSMSNKRVNRRLSSHLTIRAATKPSRPSTSTSARPMNMIIWILPLTSG